MESKIFLVVGLFMAMDIITGITKALKTKTFKSSIMREGLFHKIGLILCIAFGALADYGQTILDLGIKIPLVSSVCAYICISEIGSIIENLVVIAPQITPEYLKKFFNEDK